MTFKVSALILVSCLFVRSASLVSAAGQRCCPNGFQYISTTGKCIKTGGGASKQPACLYGENCISLDKGGPLEGICSTSNTAEKCCDTGAYNPSSKTCQIYHHDRSEYYNCTGEQRCTNGYCVTGTNTTVPEFNACLSLPEPQREECALCMGDNATNRGVWTALGCIHTGPQNLITDVMRLAMGIAGGIALLLMIYGAFQLSTSMGDPKKADEAKEVITGAIAGLLFIIFSVFLLKLIGVEILKIPGF